ncbi:MAG: O-antigen ligase family protein [Solirubrobacterales bacterium]
MHAISPRATWRPSWQIWCGTGLLLLLAAYEVKPEKLEGHWLFVTPVLIALGVLGVRRLWEQPPVYSLCAAVALTIFAGGWSQIGLGGLPVNRLFILIVMLQFALRAPGIAGLPKLQVRSIHLVMALAVLYAAASAAASGTLTIEEGFVHLTDVFGLVPFVIFFLAPSVFAGERERGALLATLVGLGVYLGITGVFEAVGPRSLVFPSYINITDVNAEGAVRVSGAFQSPVALGFATYACAVAAVMALQKWRDRRARLLAILSGATCLFACFATLERGVWIGAVVATVGTALATRKGRRWLVPGLAATLVVISLTLALSTQLANNTAQRASYSVSVWDRQNQTEAGLRMVAAKPLFGFGWDRYRQNSTGYFRQAQDYPISGNVQGITIGEPHETLPLHNTYLAYAVELGLVGLALWLFCLVAAVLGAIFRRGDPALRPWRLGLLALALFFAVISFVDPHEQPFPVVLLLLWAGLAYGPPAIAAKASRAPQPSPSGGF